MAQFICLKNVNKKISKQTNNIYRWELKTHHWFPFFITFCNFLKLHYIFWNWNYNIGNWCNIYYVKTILPLCNIKFWYWKTSSEHQVVCDQDGENCDQCFSIQWSKKRSNFLIWIFEWSKSTDRNVLQSTSAIKDHVDAHIYRYMKIEEDIYITYIYSILKITWTRLIL